MNLKKYGFEDKIITTSKIETIGRVVSKIHDTYKIITEQGEIEVEISEKLKFQAKELSYYPVVGDYVIIERNNNFNYINQVVNRKNQLIRKREWDANYDNLIATNIDTIFIMLSLDKDFHIEKLKAYISIASSLDSKIIVLLHKNNNQILDNIIDEIKSITKDMKVIYLTDDDKDKSEIKHYIKNGETVVFLGPEHDKAKMVNKLYENINLNNQLTLLPDGGVLINTPEMRELGIESINILKKFADIR